MLIDTGNFSSAEQCIVALADAGRATTVGRTTGGGSGNPMRFNLTGDAFVRFSTADFRRTDGPPIEGRGIEPDIPVELTAAHCAGADRDLAAAEAALMAEGKRQEAGDRRQVNHQIIRSSDVYSYPSICCTALAFCILHLHQPCGQGRSSADDRCPC